MTETGSRLQRRLAAGAFVVTSEISPPRGADLEAVRRAVEPLKGWVDAVNVTDNQGSNVRLSSLAGSIAAKQAGVEPVMQVTGRDRNRIALQSDLISAGALGIPNVLLMSGDDPALGDHPDAVPVFDLRSGDLLRMARGLRDDGRLLSGRPVEPAPHWFVGAVENPYVPQSAARFAEKVAAGAEFVQTQFIFDVPRFARWLDDVDGAAVLAGVGPLRSVRMAEHLRDGLGLHVPDDTLRRLRSVPSDRVEEVGIEACAETIQQLRALPKVAGVHVMSVGAERLVPAILERSGLLPETEIAAHW